MLTEPGDLVQSGGTTTGLQAFPLALETRNKISNNVNTLMSTD